MSNDKQTLGRRATSGGNDSKQFSATLPKREKPSLDEDTDD